jgi:hypothetical protein
MDPDPHKNEKLKLAPDPHYFWKLDPDSHKSEKLKLEPDPYLSKKSEDLEAQIRAMESRGRSKMEPWRVYKQDPGPH